MLPEAAQNSPALACGTAKKRRLVSGFSPLHFSWATQFQIHLSSGQLRFRPSSGQVRDEIRLKPSSDQVQLAQISFSARPNSTQMRFSLSQVGIQIRARPSSEQVLALLGSSSQIRVSCLHCQAILIDTVFLTLFLRWVFISRSDSDSLTQQISLSPLPLPHPLPQKSGPFGWLGGCAIIYVSKKGARKRGTGQCLVAAHHPQGGVTDCFWNFLGQTPLSPGGCPGI